MQDLIGKLTNLGYEIFGVVLPGIFGITFLMAFCWAIGDAPSIFSRDFFPNFSYTALASRPFAPIDILCILSLVYFIGHLLNWLSRNYGDEVICSALVSDGWFKQCRLKFWAWVKRTAKCLVFRIPRPKKTHVDELQPMLVAAAASLGIPDNSDTWRSFYPVAKLMIAERLTRSLAATYQNKYTLHRCITAGATLLFWSCVITILACMFTASSVHPRWPALGICIAGSILLMSVFSASFAFHWQMWGNTIITESFGLLSGSTKR